MHSTAAETAAIIPAFLFLLRLRTVGCGYAVPSSIFSSIGTGSGAIPQFFMSPSISSALLYLSSIFSADAFFMMAEKLFGRLLRSAENDESLSRRVIGSSGIRRVVLKRSDVPSEYRSVQPP